MDTFSVVVVARVGLVSAEPAANDLTDDLVHHEHQDCSDQNNPAQRQQEKSKHEQGFIAI